MIIKYFLILFFSIISTNSIALEIPESKFESSYSPVFLTSGFVNFSSSKRSEDSNFKNKYLPDNSSINHFKNNESLGNDSQIYLKSGFITDDKTIYGAVAKLEYNINTDNNKTEKLNLDQAFIYQESKFGKIEFGNNKAVNQKMKVGPARFARGAGGINGKYLENVNFSIFSNSSMTFLVPDL